MMIAKIKTMVVICAAALAATTGPSMADKGAPVPGKSDGPTGAPGIVSWFNSKTNDRKTAFLVKQGEKVTFKVKTTRDEKYQWRVDKDVQKETKGNSFTWTVPHRKGIWKIHLRANNKIQRQQVQEMLEDWKGYKVPDKEARRILDIPLWTDARYRSDSQMEWIVSTFVRTVEPGDSIQKAVDSVPPEGGIVILASGIFSIDAPIRIKRNNIALTGSGMDKTKIVSTKPGKAIYVSYWDDYKVRGKYVYENHLHQGCDNRVYHRLPRIQEKEVVRNVVIKDLCLYRGKGKGPEEGSDGLLFAEVVDSVISGVKDDTKGGIGLANCVNVTVRQCICLNNYSGIGFFGSTACNIVDNTVVGAWRTYGIDTNGFNMWANGPKGMVARNTVRNTTATGMFIYSASGAMVSENLIENCRRNGLDASLAWGTTYRRNIIRHNRWSGIKWEATNSPQNNYFVGNLIYRNGRHGIEFWQRDKSKGLLGKEIISNTIWGNKADGIHNPYPEQPLLVGNNIIAANRGAGIRGAIKRLSYNNLWNNAGGNYSGCSAGAGDISKDPLFADPDKGDFHLKSKAGRWNPKAKKWVKDNMHSPCIDAGDPKSEYRNEPLPNGKKINMGAYANTKEASKSP